MLLSLFNITSNVEILVGTWKMMFSAVSRFILPTSRSYLRFSPRYLNGAVNKHGQEQMDYVKSSVENKIDDWNSLKTNALSMKGSLNAKNIDAVLLKVMVNHRKLETARSFAEHLKSSVDELNLGVINGLLLLYCELGIENKLTDKERQFILESYDHLYKKYKLLDSTTCEKLLHALCAIDECDKAQKVLEDIFLSCTPTHSAFSTLIASLFRQNKKTEALELIERSLRSKRPLQDIAYEAWINYVLKKYKDKKTIVKYLDEICENISTNFAVIPEKTAQLIKETYSSIGWNVKFARIRKQNGECCYCKSSLECLKITEDEFQLLQSNVKEKMIVGSDVLLRTSPGELNKFMEFLQKTVPYDIVLDALNICYGTGRHTFDKLGPLTFVVEHFRQQNKKILLIGRKHMLKWPKMKYLLSKTNAFFIDNISQDDPYFITAAILSGSQTDFVSKDQLRGHRFQLQDQNLRQLFQRWQWQHQWRVFVNKNGGPVIQPPLPVTPCAQKKNGNWHLPYELEDTSGKMGVVRDGTPDWSSWLCLQAPVR